MRLTLLLVALFGLYICLSLAEISMIEDDASEPLDARIAIFGKGKPKPKSAAAGRSKSTKATSQATVKATFEAYFVGSDNFVVQYKTELLDEFQQQCG
ncbi:hypothetical protein KC332_g13985 [Hortaea werneckii]|nr:hypothetical protein KC350_g13552 [Hortaea werneckii]KAI6820944.1 hypothetical protein KC358_g9257 [Hortaea werneckii]KAI6908029.1 hypothetical protein KC348_g14006 [Hortaea werneckii]KAI6925022.1 hypothetical protein KC341_g13696 [Hortaea werneckii]KAI6958675.1 hypothetical protein KC321_g13875 [Hortaea werneckii]